MTVSGFLNVTPAYSSAAGETAIRRWQVSYQSLAGIRASEPAAPQERVARSPVEPVHAPTIEPISRPSVLPAPR